MAQVIQQGEVSWGRLGRQLDRAGRDWDSVLGVRPTGWAHGRQQTKEESLAQLKVETRGQVSLLEVPYSEHSSFTELKRFVQFLNLASEHRVIPTVDLKRIKEMQGMFRKWIRDSRLPR